MYDISLVIHTSQLPTVMDIEPVVHKFSAIANYSYDSHPDVFILRPLEDKVSISIDQVHALHSTINLSPVLGQQKVIVIFPAHALTIPAQQALLKLVEEPPSKVLFLLLTHTPYILLPTILSRCRIVSLHLGESIERGTSPMKEVGRNFPKSHAEAIRMSDEFGAKKDTALAFINGIIETEKDPHRLRGAIKALGLLHKNINAKLVLDQFFFSILSS